MKPGSGENKVFYDDGKQPAGRDRGGGGVAAFSHLVAVCLVVAACSSGTEPVPDPSEAPTSTFAPAQPTVAPSAIALPALGTGTIVIAQPGSMTASADGVVVFDAETAVADENGGLVVLRNETILRVAPDGTETTLLEASDLTSEYGPVTLRLEDVTVIEGITPSAVLVVGYGQDYPDVFQEIWLLDLDTGETESIYQLVTVESNIARVTAAAGTMIASVSFEGGSEFVYLTTAGRLINLPGPYADTPIGSPEFPELITEAALSPGGRDFAYIEVADIQTYESGFLAANLVVWDLDASAEVRRIEIELADGAWPGRLDYNGSSAVLGLRNLTTDHVLTPLHIASLEDGTITELGTLGTPSLVKTGASAAG